MSMPTPETIKVPGEKLYNIAYKTFLRHGLSEEDAHWASDVLSLADLRGVDTHGLNRLYMYIGQLKGKAATADAKLEILRETDNTLFLDANNAMGIVASPKAMNMTIDKARRSGICFTVMRQTGHFGMAAYYTLQAAEAGLIGFVCSGGVPVMAAAGGRGALINNMPWSLAFPAGTHYPYPVLTDMACSEVAAGKLELARRAGKKVPLSWFVDTEGVPCDDPNEFFRSWALQPFGGAKGYCLAVMMDMLCSVMGGQGFDHDVKHGFDNPQNISITFAAIDPACIRPMEEYVESVDRYTDMIKNCPPARGVEEVFLPGEIEQRTYLRRKAEGVDFSLKLANELAETLKKDGMLAENATLDDMFNM